MRGRPSESASRLAGPVTVGTVAAADLREENASLRQACHRALCSANVLRAALAAFVATYEGALARAAVRHGHRETPGERSLIEGARAALAATAGCLFCGEPECGGMHRWDEDDHG